MRTLTTYQFASQAQKTSVYPITKHNCYFFHIPHFRIFYGMLCDYLRIISMDFSSLPLQV